MLCQKCITISHSKCKHYAQEDRFGDCFPQRCTNVTEWCWGGSVRTGLANQATSLICQGLWVQIPTWTVSPATAVLLSTKHLHLFLFRSSFLFVLTTRHSSKVEDDLGAGARWDASVSGCTVRLKAQECGFVGSVAADRHRAVYEETQNLWCFGGSTTTNQYAKHWSLGHKAEYAKICKTLYAAMDTEV